MYISGPHGGRSDAQPVWRGQRDGSGPSERGEAHLLRQAGRQLNRTAARRMQGQGRPGLCRHETTNGKQQTP